MLNSSAISPRQALLVHWRSASMQPLSAIPGVRSEETAERTDMTPLSRHRKGAQMTQSDNKDRVVIFDTTLRDGEQSPGATMTHDEKLGADF